MSIADSLNFMIESSFIDYQNSRLHYVSSGSGQHTLLFFHGFGQDHSVYLPLIKTLAPYYKLYIFDLYFHGRSVWPNGEQPLEKSFWKEVLQVFFRQKDIGHFSVVGYSLGGKFALATLEAFPEKIHSLFLIAPDGIRTSFWYSMATYPFILRRFFRGMIGNYERFKKIATYLHQFRLVDHGLIRFADFQMGTEEKRKRVYYSWVVFRHLSFSNKRIAHLITNHQITTTVIAGKYDRVIRPENMQALLKHLPDATFHVIEAGHSGLIYASLPYIADSSANPS